MPKKIVSIALTFILLFSIFSTTAHAAGLTAKPTSSTVLINGSQVTFDSYSINNFNYFKLRDLAYALSGTIKQFEVTWDGSDDAILLTSNRPYTVVGGEMSVRNTRNKTPTPTNSRVFLNGREVYFEAYMIEGNNYFKLRDIGQALNFYVDWDSGKNTIIIDTSKGATATEPTTFVPPPFIAPYIAVSGATVIDNIIYAKPGQIVTLEATNTSSYAIMEASINDARLHQGTKIDDTDNYTITPDTQKQFTLVFKAAAPIGYRLPIIASFFGEGVIYGSNGEKGWNWAYRSDSSKTAVVIPEDCLDVVKGSNGKIYLTYSDGVYREFKDDGTLGANTTKIK